jgi:hypothetical protein
MDRRDGAWLVAGKPSGHPGPEVAAVRDESLISEADGHQLMPESGDFASRHPRGRGRSAERVTGKRRNDDCECVRRVRPVGAWVRQESEDWQVLQEGAGPSVGE